MAVLPSNKTNSGVGAGAGRSAAATTGDKDSTNRIGKLVDPLQDSTLPTGDKRKLDMDADPYARVPPPAGKYWLKLFKAKEGIELMETDSGDKYYRANIECRVSQDKQWNNTPVFVKVSTYIGRGKDISTAAYLLVKAGYKKSIPAEANDLEIIKLVAKLLAKEPMILAWVDWSASYQDDDNRYVNVASCMEDFPEDEEGHKSPTIKVTKRNGTSETINGRLFVKEWFGKESGAPVQTSTPTPTELAPVKAQPSQVQSPAPQVASPIPPPQVIVPSASQDDLAMAEAGEDEL